MEYVFALRQGGLSEGAAAACRQLRALEPAEAAGTLRWLLDELATGGWLLLFVKRAALGCWGTGGLFQLP